MNLLLSSEAEAAGQAMASPIVWVIYFAVLIGIFYFLFYRPQKKEQKKRSALINSVEVGDSVLTTGFYGIVIDITDEDVIVEFGNNKNCRIPMKKSAIEQVEKPDAE